MTYTSTQPGLPDAYHERHFEPDGDGFVYRLVVEYEPRGGIAGFFDRVLLRRGIRRAFERTFVALQQELVGTHPFPFHDEFAEESRASRRSSNSSS